MTGEPLNGRTGPAAGGKRRAAIPLARLLAGRWTLDRLLRRPDRSDVGPLPHRGLRAGPSERSRRAKGTTHGAGTSRSWLVEVRRAAGVQEMRHGMGAC
jgi:hypothetical protein